MAETRPVINDIADWLVEIRRDIHRHPEMGYQEFRTAGLVREHLERWGLEVRSPLGGTGLVGIWRAESPGPCLGLRADMDALPIEEAQGRPWRSLTPGLMHACGHDMHTTMLLGTARVLAENPEFKSRLSGSVRFFFQPAEEGGAGAEAMIRDGALKDALPDAIFAAHVLPTLALGEVGAAEGPTMASVDDFLIEVQGRGGHAAHPDLAADPIAPAAALVERIKAETSGLEKALVAICTFNAGSKTNIIPETARLSGTIRSLDPAARTKAAALIKAATKKTSQETGLEINLEIEELYPMVFNDPEMARLAARVAAEMLGPEGVVQVEPSFGGEDMAYFLEKVPGALYRLGTRRPGAEAAAMLHSPHFDPDEGVLPLGVEMMVRLAEACLGPGGALT